MNGLVIVLISIVALGAGYLLYGRWLARKWGIDENAQTPAKNMRMVRTLSHLQSSRYFRISFHLSQVPVCNGTNLSICIRMGSGALVADRRRSLLRCGTGFRCFVCIC